MVPALAFDLLYQRWGERGDWRLSVLLGAAFVVTFAAASWPAAAFFLSPLARNPFFLADQWDYYIQLGPWRYEYWDSVGPVQIGTGIASIKLRFLVAAVIGTVTARVGLALGNWMREVQR